MKLPCNMLYLPLLPSLNEIILAKGARYSSGVNGYAVLKKKWHGIIRAHARSQGLPKIEKGYFTYVFFEKSKRRDPSNFTAGGRKIIEDALQTEFLEGDGWRNILGFADHWTVDKDNPGVTVIFSLHHCYPKYKAIELAIFHRYLGGI